MASVNFLSFVFYFSRKISNAISIRGIMDYLHENNSFHRAEARLFAKQYHLLHKLHGEAAPW